MGVSYRPGDPYYTADTPEQQALRAFHAARQREQQRKMLPPQPPVPNAAPAPPQGVVSTPGPSPVLGPSGRTLVPADEMADLATGRKGLAPAIQARVELVRNPEGFEHLVPAINERAAPGPTATALEIAASGAMAPIMPRLAESGTEAALEKFSKGVDEFGNRRDPGEYANLFGAEAVLGDIAGNLALGKALGGAGEGGATVRGPRVAAKPIPPAVTEGAQEAIRGATRAREVQGSVVAALKERLKNKIAAEAPMMARVAKDAAKGAATGAATGTILGGAAGAVTGSESGREPGLAAAAEEAARTAVGFGGVSGLLHGLGSANVNVQGFRAGKGAVSKALADRHALRTQLEEPGARATIEGRGVESQGVTFDDARPSTVVPFTRPRAVPFRPPVGAAPPDEVPPMAKVAEAPRPYGETPPNVLKTPPTPQTLEQEGARRATFPVTAMDVVAHAEAKGVPVEQAVATLRREGYNVTDAMATEALGAAKPPFVDPSPPRHPMIERSAIQSAARVRRPRPEDDPADIEMNRRAEEQMARDPDVVLANLKRVRDELGDAETELGHRMGGARAIKWADDTIRRLEPEDRSLRAEYQKITGKDALDALAERGDKPLPTPPLPIDDNPDSRLYEQSPKYGAVQEQPKRYQPRRIEGADERYVPDGKYGPGHYTHKAGEVAAESGMTRGTPEEHRAWVKQGLLDKLRLINEDPLMGGAERYEATEPIREQLRRIDDEGKREAQKLPSWMKPGGYGHVDPAYRTKLVGEQGELIRKIKEATRYGLSGIPELEKRRADIDAELKQLDEYDLQANQRARDNPKPSPLKQPPAPQTWSKEGDAAFRRERNAEGEDAAPWQQEKPAATPPLHHLRERIYSSIKNPLQLDQPVPKGLAEFLRSELAADPAAREHGDASWVQSGKTGRDFFQSVASMPYLGGEYGAQRAQQLFQRLGYDGVVSDRGHAVAFDDRTSVKGQSLREESPEYGGEEPALFKQAVPGSGKKSIGAVGAALAKLSGKRSLESARYIDQLNRALRIGAKDTIKALELVPRAGEWYKADLGTMESEMRVILPETRDKTEMQLFKMVLALNSSGQNPLGNLKMTVAIFDHYIASGMTRLSLFEEGSFVGTSATGGNITYVTRKPRNREAELIVTSTGKKVWKAARLPNVPGSIRMNGMEKQLRTLWDYLQKEGKQRGLDTLLFGTTKKQVTNPFDSAVFEEDVPLATTLLGDWVKVGRFYTNVMGLPSEVTTDVWAGRTLRRWLGYSRTDASGETAQPSPWEAFLFRKTITKLTDKVNKEERPPTPYFPMDLQALHWYYEKGLYVRAGAQDSGQISYADASRRIAAERRTGLGETPSTRTRETGHAYVGGADAGDFRQPRTGDAGTPSGVGGRAEGSGAAQGPVSAALAKRRAGALQPERPATDQDRGPTDAALPDGELRARVAATVADLDARIERGVREGKFRPGTPTAVEEGKRLVKKALLGLAKTITAFERKPLGTAEGYDVTARGFADAVVEQILERYGAVTLVGQRIRTARDLAVAAQVLRNPLFETFHIIFTKGDKVVGHSATTNRAVNSAGIIIGKDVGYDLPEYLSDRHTELGADGWWLLHNHPSGDSTPSGADQQITGQLNDSRDISRMVGGRPAKVTPGFKGHVVINSGTYSVITAAKDKTSGNVISLGVLKNEYVQGYGVPDPIFTPDKWHGYLGRSIASPRDLSFIAQDMPPKSPDHVTVIWVDSQHRVREVGVVSRDWIRGTELNAIADRLREHARGIGALAAFAVAGDRLTFNTLEALSGDGVFLDTALYDAGPPELGKHGTGGWGTFFGEPEATNLPARYGELTKKGTAKEAAARASGAAVKESGVGYGARSAGAPPPLPPDAPPVGEPPPDEGPDLGSEAARKPSDIVDKFATFWKAMLLSKPGTHVMNASGNVSMGTMESQKDLPAFLFDRLIAIHTGRVTKSPSFRGLFVEPARGVSTTVGEGWRSAREAQKRLGARKAIVGWLTGKGDPQDAEKWDVRNNISDNPWFNAFTNLVFKPLGAMDALFRSAAFGRTLTEHARVELLNRGLTPGTKKFGEELDALIANPPDPLMHAAMDDALIATFQNDNPLAEWIAANPQYFQDSFWGKALLNIVMPFVKTPTNVAARFIDYTPYAFVTAVAKQVGYKAKGQPFDAKQQRRFADDLGRATVGTGWWAAGIGLAAAGLMTGEPADTPAERQQDEADGRVPWAVRMGEWWVPVHRLSPAGTSMALGAAMYHQSVKHGERGKTGAAQRRATAMSGLSSTLKIAADQTFVRGVAGAYGAASDVPKAGLRMVEQTAGSMVPAIFAAIARGSDPKIRDTESIGDVMKSRTPGLRQSLGARRDALGRELEKPGGVGGAMKELFDPFGVRKARETEVTKEARRLGFELTGPSAAVSDTALPVGVERPRTKTEKRAFSADVGPRVDTVLGLVIQMPAYRDLPDELRLKLFTSVYQRTKATGNVRDAARRQQPIGRGDTSYTPAQSVVADALEDLAADVVGDRRRDAVRALQDSVRKLAKEKSYPDAVIAGVQGGLSAGEAKSNARKGQETQRELFLRRWAEQDALGNADSARTIIQDAIQKGIMLTTDMLQTARERRANLDSLPKRKAAP